jgi:hypothetical protein
MINNQKMERRSAHHTIEQKVLTFIQKSLPMC